MRTKFTNVPYSCSTFKKLLFTALITCSTLSVAITETQPLFNSPSNKIIVSQQNPTFTITLQSNPGSTGFSWQLLKYDTHLITLVGHRYVAPKNKKLIGAPGYDVWTFQANTAHYRVAQTGHIVMQYARPWTKEQATNATFTVIIKE